MPHRSFCRICAAACGILVTVEGDRVLQVRGDPEHPVSRGYTCPKGRALPEFHHRSDRLDHPLVDGVAVDWGTALDDLAERLRAVVDEHGPGAVGVHLGTGLAYDIAGWLTAERLIAVLGTPQRYTPVTIDNAPALMAAELVAGSSQLNPVWEPERSRLLLLFATNPVVSHGYGTALADPVTRLRDFRRSGGRVVVVDPRRTETAALADVHLPIRAGSDAAVLAFLVRGLLAEGADPDELSAACAPDDVEVLRRAVEPFDAGRAAEESGLSPAVLEDLLADVRAASPGGVASMAGTGVMMGADGLVAEWLRWALEIVTGSLDRGTAMRFNDGVLFPLAGRLRAAPEGRPAPPGPASRPELSGWAGQMPCVAMADEIRAGNLRALVVAGASPLTAFPDPEGVADALGRLDVLAAVEVVATPLTAGASHVLPATGQLERADLSMLENVGFRNGTAYTPAVVGAGGQRRPTWWILAQLARRLGIDALGGGRDPDDLVDDDVLAGLAAGAQVPFAELVAAGPHGTTRPAAAGWVHGHVLPEGRWRLAPAVLVERLATLADRPPAARGLVLTPRRQVRTVNATAYGSPDPALVLLNPIDAESAGLADGDSVRVASDHGSIVGTCSLDPGLARGTVSLTHGRPELAAAGLVSPNDGVDPLTGMPRASALPVRLEPLGQPAQPIG